MERSSAAGEPWTVARLLHWTREYFQRNALESPRLCAELLLAHALSCERLALYTRHDAIPPPQVIERFRESVRLAVTGRPIAYLIGVKDFFSLTFEVTPDVLVPRPETEVLVERTIHLVRAAPTRVARILDVGCGSGCIAVALATNLPAASICASDLSAEALAVARRNAARHALSGRIDFRHGDLFEPWQHDAPFDVIVSNPPYVGLNEARDLPAGVRDFEPHAALFAGPDGLAIIRRLAAETPARLAPNGHFLCEIGYTQADAARALLHERGWRGIVSYRDTLNHERVIHACRGDAPPAGESEGDRP